MKKIFVFTLIVMLFIESISSDKFRRLAESDKS